MSEMMNACKLVHENRIGYVKGSFIKVEAEENEKRMCRTNECFRQKNKFV